MIASLKDFINYHLRFNPLFKAKLKEILDQKSWDTEKLLVYQNLRFQALFRRAIKHTQFYPRLYADYGINIHDIQCTEDIRKLPVVTKKHVDEHLHDLYLGNRWLKSKGRTSGTTGMPTTVYRSYASVLQEGAYIWAQRYLFGYYPGMKTLRLRADLDKNVLERYDPHSQTLFLSSFNIKPNNIDWFYERIQRFSPFAIVAYPSSVEILANFFIEKNYQLNIPFVFTSSEKLYGFQQEKMRQVFNARIVDWYGNCERTIALEQRQDDHYYELPIYSVNEFLPDRTLSTGLISDDFPLIRYSLDDVISKGDRHAGDLRIDSIIGRSDDLLLLPDGTRIGRTGVFFLDVKGLTYGQIIQDTLEAFTINLVTNASFTEQSMQTMRQNIKNYAGEHLNYQVNFVEESDIVRTKAGKFKMVISSLKQHI